MDTYANDIQEGYVGPSNGSDVIEKEKSVKNLLEKFDDVNRVLENAGLTAALLNYIFHNSLEYFSLLYYFTIKKYIRISESKSVMRNNYHINMEIYTVFIHPKSILQIPYKDEELLSKIEEFINSQDCLIYFKVLSKNIVAKVISKYLEQFRIHIQSGKETFSYTNMIHSDILKTEELRVLDVLHKSIHNSIVRSQKSRCLPSPKQDIKNLQIHYDFQILAVIKAMNTQYEQFLFSKRYSFSVRHPEISIPTDTFMSCPTVKVPNKQRIKGHCFEADSLSIVSFCHVCDLILWGSHPNCLNCRNCKKAIHSDCKDMVKTCQIEQKRCKKIDINPIEIDPDKETEGQMMFDKMTKDLTKIVDESSGQSDAVLNSENNEQAVSKPNISRKPSTSKIQELRKQFSPPFMSDKNLKCTVKCSNSMNLNKGNKKTDGDTITRSKSARSPSMEMYCVEELKRLHMKYPSEDSGIAASVELLPTSQMESDDEMQVSETFKAEIELKRFSNNFNNPAIKYNANIDRRLVLMEFHHNIKFIRMTLKRFKYLLVDPWLRMYEHLDLFDLLSLNCIDKLYRLIGSLVDVIDSCQTETTYDSTIAEKVLNWLSVDDEGNRLSWLHMSTNLCCTNILQSVKVTWNERKLMYPKLNELFSVEINRLLIVDQLSNMRPLLFNLPMIVSKISKDLKKFTSFKDETKIWKEIYEKFSSLPKLINERCMPLVQLINNGTIVTSTLKYKRKGKEEKFDQAMETYIKHFPNTVFKNDFVDFQFVKISNLSKSNSGELKNSFVYIKEEVNAAALCYETEMIFLQKENEKYFLKNFRGIAAPKLFPVIRFEDVHATKQTNKDNKEFRHQLSILVMNQIILAQIHFKEESVRDMWFDLIKKTATKRKKETDKNREIMCDTSGDCVDGIDATNLRELEVINPRTEIIRARLNESVNHLITTFELISNELSTDTVLAAPLKQIREIGPISSTEFMFGYMDILKDYTVVAEKMINRSKFIDSTLLLERDDIRTQLPKLKEIKKHMGILLKSVEHADPESESSGESTLEDDITDGPETAESQSIQSYIEDVIAEALNRIQYNSKSDNSDK